MKTRIVSITAIFLLLIFCSCSGSGNGGKEPMGTLVLAMSTDNIEVFDGAIIIGTVALKRGHPVTMLLRLDALKVALKKSSYPVDNTTLAAKLSEFMKSGANVIVGGYCMKRMNHKPGDLIDGVKVGTPEVVMGALFDRDSKILSY